MNIIVQIPERLLKDLKKYNYTPLSLNLEEKTMSVLHTQDPKKPVVYLVNDIIKKTENVEILIVGYKEK